MVLGTTLHTMQLGDVLAAVNLVTGLPTYDPASVAVFGVGEAGIIGLYAGILDEWITHIILEQPPVSHSDNPGFMNILRYTDLPEAAGLVAPRPITFLTPTPEAYGFTRPLYHLHGREDAVRRRATVGQAFLGR
jgi:hypothetical protein